MGSSALDPAGLSRPERVLWTAFAGGRRVDLRSRDPARDDLGTAVIAGITSAVRRDEP